MCDLVLDILSKWVESQPMDKKAWSFLDDKGEVSDSYTYKELDRATTSLAAYLLNVIKIKKGDRVLLVFFPGLAFTASLIACFKAGIIGVPVFPPDPLKLQKDLHHFVSIQQNSGAAIALSHNLYNFAKKIAGIKNVFSANKIGSWPDLQWVSVDDILASGKNKVNKNGAIPMLPPPPIHSDIAFLQYTSGSTSEPKGVMITHGNLAHNLTLITKELQTDNSTICVSWLPQYHDMGLIGSYLGCLYCGGSGYYISPISFLKDPVLWMSAISKYKGTHTQAPNFAFALVSRKFKENYDSKLVTLDLRSVKHMINAAEPLDVAAISDFYNTFSKYHLPRHVVYPTYGLAEHTVFVCSGDTPHVVAVDKKSLEDDKLANVIEEFLLEDCVGHGDSDVSMQTIVGCGYPHRGDGVDLVIVDEFGYKLDSNKVGEIWVTSLSKASGYWDKREQTEEDFQAKLNNNNKDNKLNNNNNDNKLHNNNNKDIDNGYNGDKEYLKTGDLGFLHNKELFICGRIKDLIIVRGSNHYPQDIERTAGSSYHYSY
jgi:acyl-CoA synthetase (AMP-forming)/AMP-acid ligase II